MLSAVLLMSCTKKTDLAIEIEVDEAAVKLPDLGKQIAARAASAFRLDESSITNVQQNGNVVSFHVNGIPEQENLSGEVTALFNTNGKGIEFWNTYGNSETFPLLEALNDSLRAQVGVKEQEKRGVDTNALSLTEKVKLMDGKQEEQSQEKTGPLFSVLYSSRGRAAVVYPMHESMIGLTDRKDTALLNSYFRFGYEKGILPPKLLVAYKEEKKDGMFEVYALKHERHGGPELYGDVIKEARVEMDEQMGAPYILIELNYSAAKTWAKMTRMAAPHGLNDRPKAIAIMVGGRLLLCPVVNGEIPNGKLQISGSFTMQECRNLKRILSAPYFPYRMQLRSIDFVK